MASERIDGGEWQGRLSIVVPAYNEQDGIAATLAALVARLPAAEIIVVDDGSQDRTAAAIAEFPSVVLAQHPFNRGYGAALKTGMTVATRELVAWFDADNEHRVADLVAMAGRLDPERVAAVIGQRESSGASPLRSWGKLVIRMLARSLSVEAGKDLNCGLRVFRRDVIMRYAPLLPNGFSASITSLIILLERGYPLAFHPVELNRRLGASKVKLADGFLALPGGIGTLDEFFEAWSWNALGYHKKPFCLLNVRGYWDGLIQFIDHATRSGFMSPLRRQQLLVAASPDEALELLDEAAEAATQGMVW